MKRLLLGTALVLLLAADGLILLRAGENRRGAPRAMMELSEREFFAPPRDQDTSVLQLRLRWRHPDQTPRPRETRPSPRPGFVVFELQPNAPEGLSRLVFTEAGAGLASLRARYGDPKRYLVLPAVLGPLGFFGLQNSSVYVPPEYLSVLRRESFEVSLCSGPRNELWICGARPTP